MTSVDTQASIAMQMKGTDRRAVLPTPPTVGSGPARVILDDEKREMIGKPNHADGYGRSIQDPPIQLGLVDDNLIQSFSSSASNPSPSTADAVKFSSPPAKNLAFTLI